MFVLKLGIVAIVITAVYNPQADTQGISRFLVSSKLCACALGESDDELRFRKEFMCMMYCLSTRFDKSVFWLNSNTSIYEPAQQTLSHS